MRVKTSWTNSNLGPEVFFCRQVEPPPCPGRWAAGDGWPSPLRSEICRLFILMKQLKNIQFVINRYNNSPITSSSGSPAEKNYHQ